MELGREKLKYLLRLLAFGVGYCLQFFLKLRSGAGKDSNGLRVDSLPR